MTKEPKPLDEIEIFKMVGRYTLVIVFIIALFLILMGIGWPWWIAGIGPIVLIPLAALSWSMALDVRVKMLVK
jgi:hypothetical protein